MSIFDGTGVILDAPPGDPETDLIGGEDPEVTLSNEIFDQMQGDLDLVETLTDIDMQLMLFPLDFQ